MRSAVAIDDNRTRFRLGGSIKSVMSRRDTHKAWKCGRDRFMIQLGPARDKGRFPLEHKAKVWPRHRSEPQIVASLRRKHAEQIGSPFDVFQQGGKRRRWRAFFLAVLVWICMRLRRGFIKQRLRLHKSRGLLSLYVCRQQRHQARFLAFLLQRFSRSEPSLHRSPPSSARQSWPARFPLQRGFTSRERLISGMSGKIIKASSFYWISIPSIKHTKCLSNSLLVRHTWWLLNWFR